MGKFLSMFSLLLYVFSLLCTTKNKSNMFTNKEKFYLKQYAEYLIPKFFYYYYYLNVFLLFISLQLSSLALFITGCSGKKSLNEKIFKLFLTIVEPVSDAILIVIIFIVVDVVVVIIRPAVILPLICAAI